MDITCSAEPCPIVLNSTCVFYEGDNLIYTGINNNDNLQTALQKIDQKFQDAGLGYIFSNGIEQLVPGGAVMLGGALNKNTTIGGLYNLAFAGTLEASALITTGGSSTDFVKGDGSLDPTSYQPAGNYISNLTGDVIANGPGSVAATLATVFGAPGTYGNSGSVPSITVDGKGRITNVTPIPINYPAQSLSFVGDVEGAGFTGSPVTLTLDTVNTDIYGSNNFLKFAVNGKGLITSATPVSGGDITTALGYVPVDDAIELTINGVAHDLTANRDWNVGTVTTVGVTVGTGISASVSNPNTNPVINIINTAPDQTVNLNAGFGISISGSYPNFTITNDYPDLPNEGVTSVSAGNLSPLFTTSVTDPTTTPALSFALSSAAANTVFAGPDGGAGAPTYRALVAADIPSLAYISSISTTAPLATTGGLTPTLSISQANASTDGYLSSIDWNTFNNKEDALGYTPVPDTRQLNINGVDYDLTADRCWSVGTVTSITASAPLTGGTITGSGSVGITQASGGTDGYLSATDWSTFNGKQPAGSYITDLTGDATASGPGSACLTLASVNLATGTFGSSTQVPVITVNNKGLVTCVTTDTISGSLEFIGDVTGVGSTGTCTSLTLATVNNDVHTSETLLNIAVNGKGLITSANPTTAGDICSTLGYSPEDVANKSTCTSLGVSNTLYPTQLAVKTYVDSATAGGIILQGSWDADTNTPDISGTTTTGWAWRVDVAGTTNLGGINDWQVGDLAVKSATGWVKIDNTENVTSVFGRFGTVIATTGDYLTCQVTECGDLYYTDARVRAAVGHTAPLTYCSTTGVFGISQSNATTDGYLSSVDWNTFNDKQPLISCGTIGQYYRGDKTFQTLDTLAVPENTNLYFTDTRARSAICASSGVAYNPSTGLITNSCPDQIVSLTGGGTTSITGTYPNFTITSNDSCLGTVTSVAVSGTNIGVTGSPITSSGTIGLSLSAANVCSALGFSPYNSTNPAGYTTCTGTVTSVAACTSTTGVSITGSPITSSGTLGINVSTASSVCTGLLTAADWNTFNSHTGCTGTVTSVGLTSSTTGVSIGGSPITSSGNISLNIATASSLCTGLLTASDWNSFNSRTSCTGTVTCVNATGTNISVTGGPITTSGTIGISLSGANVCSALGYTPYNATNPNGYTTCVGTVTSAGIVATNINVCNSPVTTSGNICLNLTGANVCSALGYAPVQPNGTGASGTWGINISGTAQYFANNYIGQADANTIWRAGSYTFFNGVNVPGGDFGLISFPTWSSTDSNSRYNIQLGANIGGNLRYRSTNINGAASWATMLSDANYNSYSPTLTGGGASGTWGINITGSAGTAGSVDFNNLTNKTGGTGTYQTSGDFRAPIFYDSNDTAYYVDPNSVSSQKNIIIGLSGSSFSYAAASSGKLYFGTNGSDSPQYYNIATNMEDYNGNYTKLDFNWYTGQRFYAASVYGGFRFKEITSGATIFSINEGDANVRVTNTLITGSISYSGAITYTGSAGSTALNLATNDGYASMRVIRNNMASSPFNDGMYIGYQNASSGITRIFGGGATSGGIAVNGGGVNDVTIAGNVVVNAGNVPSYALPVNGNWLGNTGMNDQRLFLRTNGDLNHYLWNAADDWEELNAYEGTGFRITSNQGATGVLYVYGSSNGGYTYSPYSFRAPQFRFTNSGNSAYFTGDASWGARLYTDSGYIWFGPANSGHAHIYTDRPNFYFNAPLTVNGGSVINTDSITSTRSYAAIAPTVASTNWNTSFGLTPVSTMAFGGDISAGGPTGTWWFQVNMRHSNASNLWGTQLAYGWEDNQNEIYQRNVSGGGFSGWVRYLNSNNYSGYAVPIGGATLTNVFYFLTNQGPYLGSLNSARLQVYNTSNESAFMSFHRSGYYAVNFGLDADNVMRIGGWSAAANRWQLDMSGNQTVAGTSTATGFFESSDSRFKQLVQDDYRAVGVQNIKPKLYIKDGKEEVGYFAQDFKSILSSAVTESNEGFLNLSYTQVHTVKIAMVEDEVDVLKRRVSELEIKLQKYEA